MKPVIVIYRFRLASAKEICEGLEEEGLLWEIRETEADTEIKDKSAASLAELAARLSPLEVGIGITDREAVLTVQKLKGKALYSVQLSRLEGSEKLEDFQRLRLLGHNAARYVKMLPLLGCDED